MKLIDTTVAVDHLRGDERAVALLEGLVEGEEVLVCSELTRIEILAGARHDEREMTEAFFSAMSWVQVDEGIARLAGRLASDHRQAHSGIDTVDYVIAATAIVTGADLLTTNVRHFPMIGGLEVPY